jgi:hypothetical protein
MSTITAKKSESTPGVRPFALKGGLSAAPPGEYLGPGTVIEARGLEVTVELSEGAIVTAAMALAIPYEAVEGDSLLVIGRGNRHYVIGVLRGAGRTTLTLPGDVNVHAAGGSLSLSGDNGVEIRGPELEVHATRIHTIADALVQKLGSVYQRVSGLLSVQAAETHTLVEKTAFTKAKNATLLTEETVTVNGKQIHLG